MNKIKSLRTATGLTQKAFAELIGIPQRTIENWEGGKNTPPEYVINLIQHYLENENLISKALTD